MNRHLNVSMTTRVFLLLVSEAMLLYTCFLVGAVLAPLYEGAEIYLLYEGGLWQIGLMTIVLMLGLYMHDLYDDLRVHSMMLLVNQYCVVLGSGFLFQALLSYSKISIQLPKWTMVIGSVLILILAPPWRKAYSSLIQPSLPVRKVMFLGMAPAVVKIREHLAAIAGPEMAILGYLDTEKRPEGEGIPFLGVLQDLEQVIERYNPDSIVVSMDQEKEDLPIQKLLDLRFSGITVEDIATTYQSVFRRVSANDLRPGQMIFSSELSPHHWSVLVQEVYSVAIAFVGLILALPVMILVAILVKLTSPGPVFFRQKRVGLRGKVFELYKFRSMKVDAEAKTGPVWAQKNDPRVTPFGKFLRRTRLDELPQLINVLRGEMSIVGPRPERPEFVTVLAETIPFYNQRHCIKPGITGWAQINYKYGETIEDTAIKLEYDLYYMKNLTPVLDALIMFHTIKVILLQRGSQ